VTLPHAAILLPRWIALRQRAGCLLVALDFDGTLAPIVPEPEAAAILPEARAALEQLRRRPDTRLAVVSGRALADVHGRVGVPGLIYAGNHGLEIEGDGLRWSHPEAAALRERLEACGRALTAELAPLDGVWVEDKGLTLSVHYRRATDPEAGARAWEAAQRLCDDGLRLTPGKAVINVVPAVDWDKGSAVRAILDRLDPDGRLGIWAVFIGDDRTDEDAFRALEGRGDGVLVAERPPPETAAHAYLPSIHEVPALVRALAG